MTITTAAFVQVNVGSEANDGTGASLRNAFITVNENFANISDVGLDTGDINCQGSIEVDGYLAVTGNISTTSNLSCSGNISAPGYTGGNLTLTGNVGASSINATNLYGTIRTASQSSITTIGTLTALTVNNTTSAVSIGASATTGTFILGGTTSTGSIGIGRSTQNQTVNIANGAVASGNVKSLNIGTGGVSGSTTNIIIGTNTSGATGNIRLQSNVNLESTYVPSTASSSGQPGQIIWDTNYIYICVAANTWKRANISTW